VWDLIDELVRGGTTTLLTTQYLDEADRLADSIAVIDQGTVIARGTSDELKRQIGGERIEVTVEDPADCARVVQLLGLRSCGEVHIGDDPHVVVVPVDDVTGLVPVLVRDLDAAGVAVRDVGVSRATLDDVFFALTGHAAEEDGDGEGRGAGDSGPIIAPGRPAPGATLQEVEDR
jgi:ABC-2 type transport system ATP-binding protein